jgi:hypothetical protein
MPYPPYPLWLRQGTFEKQIRILETPSSYLGLESRYHVWSLLHSVSPVKYRVVPRLGITNLPYVQQTREVILPPIHNILGICKQILVLVSHQASSRFVTFLKSIN